MPTPRCADPEVMRYIGNGQPLSRSESWKYGNDAGVTVGLRYVGGRRAPCGVMIGRLAAGNLKAGQGLKLVGRCDELTGAVDLQQLRHEQR